MKNPHAWYNVVALAGEKLHEHRMRCDRCGAHAIARIREGHDTHLVAQLIVGVYVDGVFVEKHRGVDYRAGCPEGR